MNILDLINLLRKEYLLHDYEINTIILKELGITKEQHALNDNFFSKIEIGKVINIASEINKGNPLEYIYNEVSFYNLQLYVDENVLIPRSETEILVEYTLNHLLNIDNPKILDMGTGSGAISIALAMGKNRAKLIGIDKCPKAIEVAKKNANYYNLTNIEFIESDWYSSLSDEYYKYFDLIISNPPYIDLNSEYIDKQVRKYEPNMALFADKNGMGDFMKIIPDAKYYLKKGGLLLLEHGFDQKIELNNLLIDNNFSIVANLKDYAGHDRFCVGELIK